MNFFGCRRLVTLMLCCGADVIVIVNGQATTDDDIGTEENYVELTARLAKKMEDYLATAIDEIAKRTKPDESKFNFSIHRPN